MAEFVSGTTIRTSDELDVLDDDEVTVLTEDLVATLASLHRVDHDAVGLTGFGRPDGYAGRQLRRWTSQWDLVAPKDVKARGVTLAVQLAASVPRQRSTAIVHGDYRIDNTLVSLAAPGPRVVGVVDWELSTIGDPVADVAMMCAYRHPAFDLIVGEPSAWTSSRWPSVPDLASCYEKMGGHPLVDWDFHLALAYFKIGVIAAGIEHRTRAGASTGPGFESAVDSVAIYMELGLDALHATPLERQA